MERILFKAVTEEDDDGWMQCSFGNSSIDGNDYVLTTHYLKVDEVPEQMQDAKTACELMASLLNKHFYKEYKSDQTKIEIWSKKEIKDELFKQIDNFSQWHEKERDRIINVVYNIANK